VDEKPAKQHWKNSAELPARRFRQTASAPSPIRGSGLPIYNGCLHRFHVGHGPARLFPLCTPSPAALAILSGTGRQSYSGTGLQSFYGTKMQGKMHMICSTLGKCGILVTYAQY
jgi:hypothetical protein